MVLAAFFGIDDSNQVEAVLTGNTGIRKAVNKKLGSTACTENNQAIIRLAGTKVVGDPASESSGIDTCQSCDTPTGERNVPRNFRDGLQNLSQTSGCGSATHADGQQNNIFSSTAGPYALRVGVLPEQQA